MANPNDVAIKQLSWEMESVSSIEIRSTDGIENYVVGNGRGSPARASIESHYVETAAGRRMFEKRMTAIDGKVSLSVDYCDGRKCAGDLHTGAGGWDHQQIIVQQAFGQEGRTGWADRPEPLRSCYAGTLPLPKVLASAAPLGTARHFGRECDVFLISRIPGLSDQVEVVYLLDRATSIPLKQSIYTDANLRREDRPASVWTAESFDEVEGHHLALKSTFVIPSFTPGRKVDYRYPIEVKEVHFNREYPAAMFWPTTSTNDVVFDQIAGKHTGPDPRTVVKKAPAPGASPLRADAGGGWAAAIPSVSLGLGVAVLIAGLLLWWRRR